MQAKKIPANKTGIPAAFSTWLNQIKGLTNNKVRAARKAIAACPGKRSESALSTDPSSTTTTLVVEDILLVMQFVVRWDRQTRYWTEC